MPQPYEARKEPIYGNGIPSPSISVRMFIRVKVLTDGLNIGRQDWNLVTGRTSASASVKETNDDISITG
jgi:hypothetical protein